MSPACERNAAPAFAAAESAATSIALPPHELPALVLAAWLTDPFWTVLAVAQIARVAMDAYHATFYAVYRGGETPWA